MSIQSAREYLVHFGRMSNAVWGRVGEVKTGKKITSIKGNLCKGELHAVGGKKPTEYHANLLKFRSGLWFNTVHNKSC